LEQYFKASVLYDIFPACNCTYMRIFVFILTFNFRRGIVRRVYRSFNTISSYGCLFDYQTIRALVIHCKYPFNYDVKLV